jgi:hypothetical protein
MLPDCGLTNRGSILDRRKTTFFSHKHPDRLSVTPSSVFSGSVGANGLYPERSKGLKLTTKLQLMFRLRMSGAIPPWPA